MNFEMGLSVWRARDMSLPVLKRVPSFPVAMQLNAFSGPGLEATDFVVVVVVVVRGSLRSIRRRFSSREEDDLSSSFCNGGAAVPIPPRAAHTHMVSVQSDKHKNQGFSTILFEPQSCKHRRQVAVVVVVVIVVRRMVSRDRFDLMVSDIWVARTVMTVMRARARTVVVRLRVRVHVSGFELCEGQYQTVWQTLDRLFKSTDSTTRFAAPTSAVTHTPLVLKATVWYTLSL
jgi:hypothetical protein